MVYPDMPDGRTIAGRYRLLEPLGAGSVRRGLDELERRDVVVRQLRVPPELIDSATREARMAALVRHASIARVLDVPLEAGRPWVIAEFVRGTSLEQAVRSRGPLPVAQAARMGVCVLAALRAAHAAGVVHGRLDPGKVLLTWTGRAVLAGFGVPSLSVRPSSDLWSLAATLHFAVEGRPPGQVPAEGADPLRSLVRAMLHPSGSPSVEVVADTLQRLALDQPLDRLVAALGPLPPAEVAGIGLDVLAQLQSLGGVHGAVQPGSVFVDGEGRARLVAPLRSGTLPDYTAPEGAQSREADLWSLGATLFTAVEGRPPAPGALLARAGTLARVLFRLLSGNPADRPSVDELRRDLRAVAGVRR
ncbi:Serine/threonine protein kinase [Nonomuraea pusilla]|uniref:non-specific serine/threonine protein kinase n=2 Tax=Nonomuraea pusilla TaxID=46177 RepID=A0A1H8B0A6_9ACTN|nr:Serine/threonine protein kinase [Nonomuraea pusilla]